MESCSHAIQQCAEKPSNANADIAGIGVLVAFLVSAWLSVLLAIVAYWSCCVPDELLTNYDKKFSKRFGRRSERWTKLIQDTIMTLSDQQIITGIAILIAGFSQINYLSVYDWNCVIYLAWMSSTVHLTSLTYLRSYLQERKILRAWRLTGMTILFCLLFAALYPTSSSTWTNIMQTYFSSCQPTQYPGRCFWGRESYITADAILGTSTVLLRNKPSPDGVLAYFFFVISYAWKSAMLFATVRGLLGHWARAISIRPLESVIKKLALRRSEVLCKSSYKLLMTIYIPTLAFAELAVSFAGTLWTVSIGLMWGTIQLIYPRIALANTTEQDLSWGFGQVLPMLLLLSPLVAILTGFFGRDSQEDRKSAKYLLNEFSNSSDSIGERLDGDEARCTDEPSPLLYRSPTVHGASDGASSTRVPISSLFSVLDVNDKATVDALYSAIYKSKTFKAMIILINCAVAGIAGAIFGISYSSSDGVPYVFASALICTVPALWVVSATAMGFSRLYR